MKKDKTMSDPDMQPEYDFSQGIRGKYASKYAEGSNIIILSPDVAKVFPDSESVNDALRMLIKIAKQNTNTPIHK
jgi:hypothetical protein